MASTDLLKPGDPAPLFSAPVVGALYQDGDEIALASLRGQTVALVFYPKDQTPGCTLQACSLRDNWSQISQRVAVFGISADDPASHRRFIEKRKLPYPLISDSDHAIGLAYGTWVSKSMFGKKYMGLERSTFVINPDGKIQTVLRKVSPIKHFNLLLTALTNS